MLKNNSFNKGVKKLRNRRLRLKFQKKICQVIFKTKISGIDRNFLKLGFKKS